MDINVIYNEDCFETMANHIDSKSIDLIMTSPPYNMTKRKGGYADTGRYDVYVDWKSEEDYIQWTLNLYNKFDEIVKDKGIVLYNFSYSIENPSLPYKLVSEIERNTQWTLVDTIIWKKKSGLPFPANEKRLSRIWEFVFVFAKKTNIDSFNTNRKIKSISEKTGQKYYEVAYNFVDAKNNDAKTTFNQATYSSELCEKLIDIYLDNGIVYDPFIGTGTTAIACKHLGISYIGSEISELQCNYADKRIKDDII